jgi:cyclopropane fatty-acyl-phospholipid synthase-like methyltransferase
MKAFIPALRYHWLTRFYDPIVRLTTRESTFKGTLLRQADIQAGHRVLDLGCGTGTLATMVKRSYRSAEVFGLDADAEREQKWQGRV